MLSETGGASSLLLVDVGNTSTTLGLARNGKIRRTGRVPTHVTDPDRAYRRAILRLVGSHRVGDAILCSVVPTRNPVWLRVLRALCGRKPVIVSHRITLGIPIRYPRPQTIGADRLANAAAAVSIGKRPAIIADFGTALTFDLVAKDGAYLGGVIAPGLPLMIDYLAERTALLPRISMEGRIGRWGRSTEEAMRLGAVVGYRGMVREILDHLLRAFPGTRPHLFATGGYASRALKGLGMPIQIDPHLTLKGLIYIHHLNRQGSRQP